MTCHRLVLVLGLTLPISAGTAHARQSNVSRDITVQSLQTLRNKGFPRSGTDAKQAPQSVVHQSEHRKSPCFWLPRD